MSSLHHNVHTTTRHSFSTFMTPVHNPGAHGNTHWIKSRRLTCFFSPNMRETFLIRAARAQLKSAPAFSSLQTAPATEEAQLHQWSRHQLQRMPPVRDFSLPSSSAGSQCSLLNRCQLELTPAVRLRCCQGPHSSDVAAWYSVLLEQIPLELLLKIIKIDAVCFQTILKVGKNIIALIQ